MDFNHHKLKKNIVSYTAIGAGLNIFQYLENKIIIGILIVSMCSLLNC